VRSKTSEAVATAARKRLSVRNPYVLAGSPLVGSLGPGYFILGSTMNLAGLRSPWAYFAYGC
jgi:hypothetical protein